MEVKINIEPEQINQMVSQAILESVIGEKMKAAIEKELAKLSSSYDNPLEKVVAEEIRIILIDLLRSEPYYEQINAAVKKELTEEAIAQILGTVWDYINNRFR